MIMIRFASVSVIYYEVSTTSGMCYCPSHARLHGSGFTHNENETFFKPTIVYETITNDGIQNHVQRVMVYKTVYTMVDKTMYTMVYKTMYNESWYTKPYIRWYTKPRTKRWFTKPFIPNNGIFGSQDISQRCTMCV